MSPNASEVLAPSSSPVTMDSLDMETLGLGESVIELQAVEASRP